MKKIFTVGFLLISINLFAQSSDNGKSKSEISIQYNFGISNRNFKIPKNDFFERLDHTNAISYYDQGMRLLYNYSFLQKGKNRLTIGTGIGYSNSQHYQFITDPKYGYLLETPIFDSKTISIPLQFSFERELIDEKLFLELSYSLNFYIPTKIHSTYTNSVERKYDFIDYNYTINVKNENQFYHWFFLTSKLKLRNNLYLNSSLSYLTNKKIRYTYNSSSLYYLTDQNDITHSEHYSVYSLPSIQLIDKYFHLSTGLTYRF
jgi:hypothetical protein